MKYLAFVVFCLWIALVRSQTSEDEEVEQFVAAICRPRISEGIASCGDLLPQRGKNIIYSCTRSMVGNFRDNMLYAAGAFCEKEDIRDPLFRCWEDDLIQFFNTSEEAEKRLLRRFQVCLKKMLDVVFEEQDRQQN